MARRVTVGSLNSARARKSVDGFDELTRKLRRISDQSRVEILTKAVDEGADETFKIMSQEAPRNPGGPTRPPLGHGSDNITIATPKRRRRRDSRALVVGPTSFWMYYQEFGTPFHTANPFVEPTGRAMRPKMVQIVAKHMRKVLRVNTG